MPTKFDVETAAPGLLNGVWIEIDTDTGLATDIERIQVLDDHDLHVR